MSAEGSESSKWRRIGKVAGPLFSLALLCVAIASLRIFLRDHSFADVLAAMKSCSPGAVGLAIAATALSYFILTGYDWLAVRYIGKKIAYRRVAVCSFIGYALSHNIGMSALTGGSARYRFYSRYGVSMFDAARMILFCNITFWVGFVALGGVVLTLHPVKVPMFEEMPFESVSAVGLACIGITLGAGLLTAWGRGRPRIEIRGLKLHLPNFPMFARQVVVSSADWASASLVLHILLPEGFGSYFDTLSVFLIAQALAMISNLPGGVGVFEASVAYLAADTDPAVLLGVILVYRVVYYLLPLAVAVLALVAMEWRRRSTPALTVEGPGERST